MVQLFVNCLSMFKNTFWIKLFSINMNSNMGIVSAWSKSESKNNSSVWTKDKHWSTHQHWPSAHATKKIRNQKEIEGNGKKLLAQCFFSQHAVSGTEILILIKSIFWVLYDYRLTTENGSFPTSVFNVNKIGSFGGKTVEQKVTRKK